MNQCLIRGSEVILNNKTNGSITEAAYYHQTDDHYIVEIDGLLQMFDIENFEMERVG